MAEARNLDPSSSSVEAATTSSATLVPSLGNAENNRHGGEDSDQSDGGEGERFIGDLNPESIFFAATSPQTTLSPGEDHVGIWIPRRALDGFRKRLSSSTTSQSPGPDPLLSNILLPYMQRQCQQLLPPSTLR